MLAADVSFFRLHHGLHPNGDVLQPRVANDGGLFSTGEDSGDELRLQDVDLVADGLVEGPFLVGLVADGHLEDGKT